MQFYRYITVTCKYYDHQAGMKLDNPEVRNRIPNVTALSVLSLRHTVATTSLKKIKQEKRATATYMTVK